MNANLRKNPLSRYILPLFTLRWNPSIDLLIVAASWILVVGGLFTATKIVGTTTGGGLPYFFLYAILTATLFGVGIPLGWMVLIRKRPLADLGITRRYLGLSLLLQLPFASFEFYGMLTGGSLPSLEKVIPLVALSLSIGLFEAIFWRGWVLMRLEEAFGFLPAALLGSTLYAIYHIGYGMPASEMTFLFFIGLMFAAAFRLTRSIFILWPVFQPAGQLITLLKDGLNLPLIASLGFFEVMIVMWVLIWLAGRYSKKLQAKAFHPVTQPTL
jgi:membrane protease YdiL (CAAX protease family)